MGLVFRCLILILVGGSGARAVAPCLALKPKSFAVFSASYTPGSPDIQGGVAGTAFFVSPTLAVTAHHVLQPKSFQPTAGTHLRIWLVRENFRAIELRPEYLTYRPDQDLTLIRLPATESIPTDFIYESTMVANSNANVETHGFVANTPGPLLVWKDGDLEILYVPSLERRDLHGHVLVESRVTLKAQDVQLQDSVCVQLSYEPIVGISGAPVTVAGRLIGMNSFADPVTRKRTWALRLNGNGLATRFVADLGQ